MKLEFAEYFYDDDGSFNLDGTLIRQAKLTAKQIYKWGKKPCPHTNEVQTIIPYHRRDCSICWNELLEATK